MSEELDEGELELGVLARENDSLRAQLAQAREEAARLREALERIGSLSIDYPTLQNGILHRIDLRIIISRVREIARAALASVREPVREL